MTISNDPPPSPPRTDPIIVYGRRNSLNVQKVLWTLGELALPYERHDVGGSFGLPADYAHLNPNLVVPTIRDGALVLWESATIVRHLARSYGSGTLWPGDAATLALADQWMEWHRGDASLGFFPVFINLIRKPAAESDAAEVARGVKLAARAFTLLDQHLADHEYLAGDRFTMGDIPMGAMTYRYRALPIERPDLPNLARWVRLLEARPAYQYHVAFPFGSNNDEWNALEAAGAGVQ